MLDRKGASVARAADGRGDVGRQNQVWIVAGGGNSSASGGVVDKRSVGRVGIGDGEIDGRLGGHAGLGVIHLVWQRAYDARTIIKSLHQHAEGGAVGAQCNTVGVGAGGTGGEGFQRGTADLHAGGVGVEEVGIGSVGQLGEGGVDVGLTAGERQRLGAPPGDACQAGDAADIQRSIQRGEGVGDGGGAVGLHAHLFQRGVVKVVGLTFVEGLLAGIVKAGGGPDGADVVVS